MEELILGDCVSIMASMAPDSVDAIITDPPYGLEFMGKEWDKLWDGRRGTENETFGGTDGNSPNNIRKAPTYRAGKAAEDWHRTWAEQAIRVLKPGGHLLAFGGTRTHHRLMCALEDAGFEIRDTLAWIYGSGFPKSLDVSKAIDKAAGVERDVVGERPFSYSDSEGGKDWTPGRGRRKNPALVGDSEQSEKARLARQFITAPATDVARQWDGWGTALKPAHEPIVLARKSLSEKNVAANVLRWGTGAINVDGTRVAHAEPIRPMQPQTTGHDVYNQAGRYAETTELKPAGRWPPNVLLQHHPDCEMVGERRVKSPGMQRDTAKVGFADTGQAVTSFPHNMRSDGYADPDGLETIPDWRCVEGCPVAELGRQSGERPAGAFPGIQNNKPGGGRTLGEGWSGDIPAARDMDGPGTAARFFPQFAWEEIDFWPFLYVAKASRAEREQGLRGLKAVDAKETVGRDPNSAGAQNPRAGAGRGAGAKRMRCAVCGLHLGGGRAVTSCKNEGEHIPVVYDEGPRMRNHHPTVKPLALMRWLCRLITPPQGLILDPFMRSGTTGMAARMEGFRFVGIELDAEYLAIARVRLEATQPALT